MKARSTSSAYGTQVRSSAASARSTSSARPATSAGAVTGPTNTREKPRSSIRPESFMATSRSLSAPHAGARIAHVAEELVAAPIVDRKLVDARCPRRCTARIVQRGHIIPEKIAARDLLAVAGHQRDVAVGCGDDPSCAGLLITRRPVEPHRTFDAPLRLMARR